MEEADVSRIDRRQFVGGLLAGAGAVVGARAAAAQAATANGGAWPIRSATDTVTLGNTGLRTSFLGIGTGVRGWMGQSNATRMGEQSFDRLIRHAYDRGIRLYDVADLYGTHTWLRRALADKPRDSYTIQSKIWFSDGGMPEPTRDARAAVDRFRQELGTDYLDTVLLHCTTSGNWTHELSTMRDQLDELKAEGVVRAHGTSCHSRPALDAGLASNWVDVQLARVNHAGHHLDGTPAEIAELLRTMRAAGKGVIGMKIYGEGRLKTVEEREQSLRFVLGQGCVDAIIIGMESPEQVDETMARIEGIVGG